MGFRNPEYYFDRELSWLDFNQRVLEEALDPTTPLLERLRFLTITATNLDEFFMIRVSGVQEQIQAGLSKRNAAGLTPQQQFDAIHHKTQAQVEAVYRCYREDLLPALEEHRLAITHPAALSRKCRKELRDRFTQEFFPVLTPLGVDSSHPFPRIKSLSLNLILQLEGPRHAESHEPLVAIVPVPAMLPRLVEVAPQRDKRRFVLLEDVIMEHVSLLFPGMKITEAMPFRITRDADVEYKEIDADDLLKAIQSELRERERGTAVRLQIDYRASDFITNFLMRMLGLQPLQVYRLNGPLALKDLSQLSNMKGYDELRYPAFAPNTRRALRAPGSIFSKIRNSDILLHHPYESFNPVLDFIRAAAEDPKVLAIKQTLYRTSGDSPIIKSLIRAAENGKQVAALVELKARFDEENNIGWAQQLEEAGVHVIYGLVGLKTHAKVSMIVRREQDQIRRYVHVSTGNYNPTTARIYTDLGLFTCDPGFCDDASELFNMLTGYARRPRFQRMIVAPTDLRPFVLGLINEQRERAEAGKPARIRAKFNSLVDAEIIAELCRASAAGVPIDLNIRGVCCLRPGVKGVSDTVRVWSIVDRYLEHSRLFAFGEDGPDLRVFISSADWMERNMDRRIEVLVPILDPNISSRIVNEVFGFCARDNVKARYLGMDGIFRKAKPRSGESRFRSQDEFMKLEDRDREGQTVEAPPVALKNPELMDMEEEAISPNARLETMRSVKPQRVPTADKTPIPEDIAAPPKGDAIPPPGDSGGSNGAAASKA